MVKTKIAVFLLTAMALSVVAVAQDPIEVTITPPPSDVYWVTYYSNRNNAPGLDATVRIINPNVEIAPQV